MEQQDRRCGEEETSFFDDDDNLAHTNSRLLQDFTYIREIGRGGFGKVVKVRNNIDSRVYAVKLVPLRGQNSKKHSMRILDEVMCLSPLCHEHVVRYYTSWVESVVNEDSRSQDKGILSRFTQEVITSMDYFNSRKFGSDEDAESDDEETEDEDESSSINDVVPQYDETEVSDFVVFEGSQSNQPSESKQYNQHKDVAVKIQKRYLLIQMEFCEKRTIRHAIDEGLYLESTRLWRLFREMVRGLDYIHSQNLIHRDLKPGNMFIDSQDHVKIGDFGLAKVDKSNLCADDLDDASNTVQTDNVGTFFYIAPEKDKLTTKFDIYSLGIIFFEMVCILPKSGHERYEILKKARKENIELTHEFSETQFCNKKAIVKWLLNHKPEKRPSAAELLKSDLLPPLSTEEKKFKEKLDNILQKYNSDVYLDILRNFFKSKELGMNELSFMHLTKSNELDPKQMDAVADVVKNIFRAHGGIWLSAPLYVPKGSFYNDNEFKNVFNIVTENGNPLTFCPDLRYPFARLVAIKGLQSIRRYTLDHVKRHVKILAADFPLSRVECAFDFIGEPRETVEFCGRIMKIGQDVIKTLSEPKASKFFIDVAYLPLTEFILDNSGIPKSRQGNVRSLIKSGVRENSDPNVLYNNLLASGCNEKACNTLKRYLSIEGPADEVISQLKRKGPPRHKHEAEFLLKLKELENIIEAARAMDVDMDIFYRPLLIPEDQLYCGFMCQFMANKVNKKKVTKAVILGQGGVYDSLITRHRDMLPPSQISQKPVTGVGISFSLETLVIEASSNIELKVLGQQNLRSIGCGCSGDVTVLVATDGEGNDTRTMLREKVEMVRELRNKNITSDFSHIYSYTDLDDVSSPYVVLLDSSSDSDKSTVKYNYSRRGFWSSEKRVATKDVVECVVSLLTGETDTKGSVCSNVGPAAAAEESIKFECITRKAQKQKESTRPDEQQTRKQQREVESLLLRWPGSFKGHQVLVCCLDLDRDVMLQLACLDLDSNARNYAESLKSLKERLNSNSETWEYVEKCAKFIHSKVFNRKASERSLCIIAYSSTSDSYKRIY